MESVFSYFSGSRLYIWKKIPKIVTHSDELKEDANLLVPKLSDSRLRDLTWSLGIKESSNPVTLAGGWKEGGQGAERGKRV
jgi:hypothetical protein